MYECCVGGPVKGAVVLVKHPIALLVVGGTVLFIYAAYGMWPFIALAVLATLIICAFVYFSVMNVQRTNPQEDTIRIKPMRFQEMGACQRHPMIRATTVLNVTRGDKSVRLVLCSPCAVEAKQYINQRELTGR